MIKSHYKLFVNYIQSVNHLLNIFYILFDCSLNMYTIHAFIILYYFKKLIFVELRGKKPVTIFHFMGFLINH